MKIKFSNGVNQAYIEKFDVYAYKGAHHKTPAYRVWAFAPYDNNFVYHVSTFETMTDALKDLERIGGGFKEMKENV